MEQYHRNCFILLLLITSTCSKICYRGRSLHRLHLVFRWLICSSMTMNCQDLYHLFLLAVYQVSVSISFNTIIYAYRLPYLNHAPSSLISGQITLFGNYLTGSIPYSLCALRTSNLTNFKVLITDCAPPPGFGPERAQNPCQTDFVDCCTGCYVGPKV